MSTVVPSMGSLGQTCYTTWQSAANAFAAAMTITLPDNYIQWIVQSGSPAPADQDKLWLHTDGADEPLDALRFDSGAWKRWVSLVNVNGTVGGAANAFTLTFSPVFSAYKAGQVFCFKANHAITGAATLNVDGLGALAIVKMGGTALVTGDIVADQMLVVVYDGLQFQMVSDTPGSTVPHGAQILSSGAGNWVVPTNVFSIEAECVAGGGGGGYSASAKGGGGGGYCYKRWVTTPGQSIPYSVGAGGTAGNDYGAPNSTDGGNSTFNTTQIANGGAKGDSGGAGGAHSGGDYGFTGEPGTAHCNGQPDKFYGGKGAFGPSYGGKISNLATMATYAGAYGGGGLGDSDGTGANNSAGGSGLIIVRW